MRTENPTFSVRFRICESQYSLVFLRRKCRYTNHFPALTARLTHCKQLVFLLFTGIFPITTMYSPELAAENTHFPGRLMCVNAGKRNDFLCLPFLQRVENLVFSFVRNHFCTVNETFMRVFQSKACIFQHFFPMVNSSKFDETHFLAFYRLLLFGYPMENNSYSAIHSRFAHSNFIFTGVNQSKTCIFRHFLCNGEFELINARHAFSRVYRRSVNHCSSNSIQWISPPKLNHTEGSKRILSHFTCCKRKPF